MFALRIMVGVLFLAIPAFQQEQQPRQLPSTAESFRLVGIVVDSQSGRPLPSAEVRATLMGPLENSLAALTCADGRFVFESVKPGKYSLTASRRGYVTRSYQQHEYFTTAIIVGPGQESENLVFDLQPGSSISGQVTDELSDPVRGAQVMLFRQSLNDGRVATSLRMQTSTNDQGQYRFGRLEPGTYFVCVSAQPWYAQYSKPLTLRRVTSRGGLGSSGGADMSTDETLVPQPNPLDVVYAVSYYPGETEPARAAPLRLLPDERATADFILHPVPSVHLKLKLPGAPGQGQFPNVQAMQSTIGNHQIYLQPQSMALNGDTIEVGGLPPGRLTLNVVEWQEGKQTFRVEQEVDVSRDGEIALGEHRTSPLVSGIVRASRVPAGVTAKTAGTATAMQQKGIHIQIRDRASGQAFYASIAEDGRFDFQGQMLKTGTYDVLLVNFSGFYVERVLAAGAKPAGTSFELAGDAVRLTVEISSGLGRVDGVVLRDTKPVGGVMVLLVPADGSVSPSLVYREQSDSDGTFSWTSVRPGQYTAVAIQNGWNLEWAKPEMLKLFTFRGEPVHVAADGHVKITVNVQ